MDRGAAARPDARRRRSSTSSAPSPRRSPPIRATPTRSRSGPDDEARERFREFARKQLGSRRSSSGSPGESPRRCCAVASPCCCLARAARVRLGARRRGPRAYARRGRDRVRRSRSRAGPGRCGDPDGRVAAERRAASTAAFAYPGRRLGRAAASTTASATTDGRDERSATAESVVTGLSLFGGEITADAVTARASRGDRLLGRRRQRRTGAASRTSWSPASRSTADATSVTLGDWGQLTIGDRASTAARPAGRTGYRGFVTELDIHLTADHGGLPASSEIQIGYAEAAAQTRAAGARAPATTTDDRHRRRRRRTSRAPATRRASRARTRKRPPKTTGAAEGCTRS